MGVRHEEGLGFADGEVPAFAALLLHFAVCGGEEVSAGLGIVVYSSACSPLVLESILQSLSAGVRPASDVVEVLRRRQPLHCSSTCVCRREGGRRPIGDGQSFDPACRGEGE